MVSGSCHSNYFSSIDRYHFFLTTFKILKNFCFLKSYFDLSWGFSQLFSSYRFLSFCQIWDIFSHDSFERSFSMNIFLLFWESNGMDVRSFVFVSLVPEVLLLCPHCVSSVVYIGQFLSFYLQVRLSFCSFHSAEAIQWDVLLLLLLISQF